MDTVKGDIWAKPYKAVVKALKGKKRALKLGRAIARRVIKDLLDIHSGKEAGCRECPGWDETNEPRQTTSRP